MYVSWVPVFAVLLAFFLFTAAPAVNATSAGDAVDILNTGTDDTAPLLKRKIHRILPAMMRNRKRLSDRDLLKRTGRSTTTMKTVLFLQTVIKK